MELAEYFPVWDQLEPAQRERLSQAAVKRSAKKGTLLHNGSEDCLGLIVVISGQLGRVYALTKDGKLRSTGCANGISVFFPLPA